MLFQLKYVTFETSSTCDDCSNMNLPALGKMKVQAGILGNLIMDGNWNVEHIQGSLKILLNQKLLMFKSDENFIANNLNFQQEMNKTIGIENFNR